MKNRLYIGIDEAGYGPNLGPLIVARSVWQVPANLDEEQLTCVLSQRFQPRPWGTNCQHVPLGDSKQLYQSSGSLQSLEAGLLAMLAQLPSMQMQGLHSAAFPRDFQHLSMLCGQVSLPPTIENSPDGCPIPDWYSTHALLALCLPCASTGNGNGLSQDGWRQKLSRLAERAADGLAELPAQLLDLQALVVRERDFNIMVERQGSKGQVLADATLRLLVDAVERWPDCDIHFYCDRQGGRKDYLPLLLRHMPDDWFQQLRVDNLRSSYRRQRDPEVRIHFSVKGDAFPPTGLASMLAKYFRERHMQAFNAYWQQHVPGIRPTAGYPVDAKRFRCEIENTALRLGMDPRNWWRCK